MIEKLFNRQEQETEEHWVSISDVMAGLMVIFLFIAISYMKNINDQIEGIKGLKVRIENLIDVYTNLQRALSEELKKEFEDDPEWTIFPETLSIRFKEPFTQDDATVPNDFKKVLNDFFPRYIKILTKSKYKNDIAEIRIEGHTSSEWFDQITGNEAYIKNMELSQNRARNVLDYVLRIADSDVVLNRAWLRKNLTANGLSSSQLILNLNTVPSRPSNTYDVVERETGIPSGKINQLYQRIRSLPRNNRSSREDIVINLIEEFPEFEHNTVAVERTVDLLMENRGESRRVEFRVVTKLEKLIDKIKEIMEEFEKEGEVK